MPNVNTRRLAIYLLFVFSTVYFLCQREREECRASAIATLQMSGLLRYWCSKACTTRSITESYAKLYVFQRPLSSTCRKTFQQSYQWRFPREPEKNRESEKKGKKESVSKVEAEEEKDEKTENDSSKGSITANKSGLFKLILPLSPASPLHSDHQGDKLLFFLVSRLLFRKDSTKFKV